MKAFHNWVNSQIRYPAEAFKNNLGGKVVAQFTYNPQIQMFDGF